MAWHSSDATILVALDLHELRVSCICHETLLQSPASLQAAVQQDNVLFLPC